MHYPVYFQISGRAQCCVECHVECRVYFTLVDVLPQPFDSVEDLVGLNTCLGDEHYIKIVITCMFLFCSTLNSFALGHSS